MDERKIIYPVLWMTILLMVGIVCISRASEYEKVPILMVHGLWGSSNVWAQLREYLMQNGYSANLLYAIDITTDNSVLCSTNHVTQISNKIEQIVSESGYDRVDVIGHSRGGLNLYDYMRFDNGANRVRNWISLAGANNMTCSGSYGSAPNDPTPGNETLYTSIYSNSDTLVSPEMAIIEGARNIELSGIQHTMMTITNTVFPYVLDALKGTGLNDGDGMPSPENECGNGQCNGNETCNTCPQDCGSCQPQPGIWQGWQGWQSPYFNGSWTWW